MTTTSTFQGLDPEGRSSSRILRPPGGGSSFTFGVEASKQQPARRHKMASNIFGLPDNEPAPTSCAPEPGPSESAACGDDPHRTCTEAEYSDIVEHTDEAEVPETEPATEASGEPAQPAPPVAVPSRRNPPGGKSSLILG
ncbi:jupiter microtubule associated homolog 1 [Eleutherodactylus coqui]|uniref:jupiter microtubule associated homolog 1 n=1 Tax=Eleutherodactylus coqui TaxID=57060 RepID=UPI003461A055